MAELDCTRLVTPIQDNENCLSEDLTVGKQSRSSPTGCTPIRQAKRVPLRSLANHEAQDEFRDSEPPQDEISQDLQLAKVAPQPRTLITASRSAPNIACDSKEKWTEKELKALAEFILFHTPGYSWPGHKHQEFWISASDFIKERVNTPGVRRSGMF